MFSNASALLNFLGTIADSPVNCTDPNSYDTPACNPEDTQAWADIAVPTAVVGFVALGLYLCCKVPCIREPVKKWTDPICQPFRHALYPFLCEKRKEPAQNGKAKDKKAAPLLAKAEQMAAQTGQPLAIRASDADNAFA